jgi:hypothetical protein
VINVFTCDKSQSFCLVEQSETALRLQVKEKAYFGLLQSLLKNKAPKICISGACSIKD